MGEIYGYRRTTGKKHTHTCTCGSQPGGAMPEPAALSLSTQFKSVTYGAHNMSR